MKTFGRLKLSALTESSIVMRGLDPRIHLLEKRWIAGSSPAMTPGGASFK
jgi:hypothetical protein